MTDDARARPRGTARPDERARHPDPAAEPASPVGAPTVDREREALFFPTLLKVLLVQVVALALLWLLQATYHQ